LAVLSIPHGSRANIAKPDQVHRLTSILISHRGVQFSPACFLCPVIPLCGPSFPFPIFAPDFSFMFSPKRIFPHTMKRLLLSFFGCFLLVLLASNSGCQAPAEKPVQVAEESAQPEASIQSQPVMNAKVRVTTSHGDLIIRLYDETPQHRDNFLKLVNEKFYDDLLFHRCIKGFMAQGGDPQSRGAGPNTPLGMGGPGYTVPAEFNASLIHKKGALCAARQGDQVNPERRSSGSQFYIVQGTALTDDQLNQVENYISYKTPGFKYTEAQRNVYKTIGGTAQLDMDYTVFGEVIEGLEVIDAILGQPTRPGDRPVEDITMKMTVIRD
jgi:cyclophilin family peptidyl-prolyl cis-trans isomerase